MLLRFKFLSTRTGIRLHTYVYMYARITLRFSKYTYKTNITEYIKGFSYIFYLPVFDICTLNAHLTFFSLFFVYTSVYFNISYAFS